MSNPLGGAVGSIYPHVSRRLPYFHLRDEFEMRGATKGIQCKLRQRIWNQRSVFFLTLFPGPGVGANQGTHNLLPIHVL